MLAPDGLLADIYHHLLSTNSMEQLAPDWDSLYFWETEICRTSNSRALNWDSLSFESARLHNVVLPIFSTATLSDWVIVGTHAPPPGLQAE
jgi:hypothetical protein